MAQTETNYIRATQTFKQHMLIVIKTHAAQVQRRKPLESGVFVLQLKSAALITMVRRLSD